MDPVTITFLAVSIISLLVGSTSEDAADIRHGLLSNSPSTMARVEQWAQGNKQATKLLNDYKAAEAKLDSNYWTKNNGENIRHWESTGLFGMLASVFYNAPMYANNVYEDYQKAEDAVMQAYEADTQADSAVTNKLVKL